ncbi:MAG: prepilin-type N-terminal cleavage/methylation domain-containing protein [Gemmataceae bacterium]|jgi:prepilin-type N-terminal cleavage/methylation domain-containing protein|nr:prepilin-type N-terminal cleavage/methylation domain-containing protein [Gemmataceae bacterium]
MRLSRLNQREGFSLLEVLVSTAIFLIGLAGISQLSNLSSKMAVEAEQRSVACRLTESKLNDFIAGIEAVSAGGSGTFDDEPDWQWEVTSSNDTGVNGLYRVTIRVYRESPFFLDGIIEVTSAAYIVDPSIKGRADTPQETPSSGTPSSGTTDSGSTSGSSSGSTTGGTTTTPMTGSTTPSTGGGLSGGGLGGLGGGGTGGLGGGMGGLGGLGGGGTGGMGGGKR